MALRLEASINTLWQNLVALNASLAVENEEQRTELSKTKELLEKVCIFTINRPFGPNLLFF